MQVTEDIFSSFTFLPSSPTVSAAADRSHSSGTPFRILYKTHVHIEESPRGFEPVPRSQHPPDHQSRCCTLRRSASFL